MPHVDPGILITGATNRIMVSKPASSCGPCLSQFAGAELTFKSKLSSPFLSSLITLPFFIFWLFTSAFLVGDTHAISRFHTSIFFFEFIWASRDLTLLMLCLRMYCWDQG